MIRSQSPIVHISVRAATPLAAVAGIYLFFAGHNQPGGGFAAGLVLGAVVILRSVAGLRTPDDATVLVATGMAIIVAVAAAPLVWGDLLLDQKVVSLELPLFGKIKSGSALLFDAGVVAVVIGLIVSLLNGLAPAEFSPESPGDETST